MFRSLLYVVFYFNGNYAVVAQSGIPPPRTSRFLRLAIAVVLKMSEISSRLKLAPWNESVLISPRLK